MDDGVHPQRLDLVPVIATDECIDTLLPATHE